MPTAVQRRGPTASRSMSAESAVISSGATKKIDVASAIVIAASARKNAELAMTSSPRTGEVQAEATGTQKMDAAFETHHEQGDAYRAGRADQHDLVQGIVAAQPFDERVLQDEDGDRPDDAGDPECPLVHSSRAPSMRRVSWPGIDCGPRLASPSRRAAGLR